MFGWFTPAEAPAPKPPPPPPVMKRVNLEEVWSDGRGMMAVKRKDGQYNFYIDPDALNDGMGDRISNHPKIRFRLNQALLSIISVKQEES
jgi:hypothetical protein